MTYKLWDLFDFFSLPKLGRGDREGLSDILHQDSTWISSRKHLKTSLAILFSDFLFHKLMHERYCCFFIPGRMECCSITIKGILGNMLPSMTGV